jgi:hypothetical protein
MYSDLMALIGNPLLWKVLGCYWLFSAAVSPMPMPTQKSSPFYVWFFGFMHALSGNLNRAAVALRIPGAEGSK